MGTVVTQWFNTVQLWLVPFTMVLPDAKTTLARRCSVETVCGTHQTSLLRWIGHMQTTRLTFPAKYLCCLTHGSFVSLLTAQHTAMNVLVYRTQQVLGELWGTQTQLHGGLNMAWKLRFGSAKWT